MLPPEQQEQYKKGMKQVNLGKYYQIEEKRLDNAFSPYNCKKRLDKLLLNAKRLNSKQGKTITLHNGRQVFEKDLTEEEKELEVEIGFNNK